MNARRTPERIFAADLPHQVTDVGWYCGPAEHDRDDLRYPSDLTDAEWRILAPLLPPPAETGRHRSWPMRELMNAIFFVLRGGCPWRMLPEHFPPHQTAYRWFIRFREDGTWESLNHHLVMMDRERVGREAR